MRCFAPFASVAYRRQGFSGSPHAFGVVRYRLWRIDVQMKLRPRGTATAAPLTNSERISSLGRVLTDPGLPLQVRVAATIVLLYAQPLSRVVRLTLDDVIRDGTQVLRLGEPPSPVPAPASDLLLEWIGNRGNMNTATNRDSPLAVPRPQGRAAREPQRPRRVGERYRDPRLLRASVGDPAARPGTTGPRGGRRPQLPPCHHCEAGRPGRRHLQPLRPR
jgi:hypothetical protein